MKAAKCGDEKRSLQKWGWISNRKGRKKKKSQFLLSHSKIAGRLERSFDKKCKICTGIRQNMSNAFRCLV